MSEAVRMLRLEGKDWLRENEAAEYAGLSLGEFRGWYPTVGVTPKRVGVGKRGRKLYSRTDLYVAIDRSPEWQPSTKSAGRGISAGLRAGDTTASPLDPLRPGRRREYVQRKPQS